MDLHRWNTSKIIRHGGSESQQRHTTQSQPDFYKRNVKCQTRYRDMTVASPCKTNERNHSSNRSFPRRAACILHPIIAVFPAQLLAIHPMLLCPSRSVKLALLWLSHVTMLLRFLQRTVMSPAHLSRLVISSSSSLSHNPNTEEVLIISRACTASNTQTPI